MEVIIEAGEVGDAPQVKIGEVLATLAKDVDKLSSHELKHFKLIP